MEMVLRQIRCAIDVDALGDVVYLEGVSGIDGVNFERFQVGREGENSLKISATVTAKMWMKMVTL